MPRDKADNKKDKNEKTKIIHKPPPIKIENEKTAKEKAEKLAKEVAENETAKAAKQKAAIKERKAAEKAAEKERKAAEKAKKDEEEKERKAKLKEAKELEKKKLKYKSKYPFSDQLVRSFFPIRMLLLSIGRIPLSQRKKEPGNYIFSANLFSFQGFYFLFTTAILLYILIVGTTNLFIILMNIDTEGDEIEEDEKIEKIFQRILIQRHLVTVIILWTALVHNIMVSIAILMKKSYMANYFSFWARAVDTMYMDVGNGALKHSLLICLIFLMTIAGLVVMSFFHLGPSTRGAPLIMSVLMFRNFIKEAKWIEAPEGSDTRQVYQIVGGVFLMFVFVSSKVYILLFLYKCKLLRNAFANWNGRVYAAVLRGGDFIQNDRGRTTFRLLFKDHCILLDLMEGTDHLFSMIIESYFGLQVCSICFEAYFMIRTAKYGDKAEKAASEYEYFVRQSDWGPGALIVVQSLAILVIVSKAAAEVGEEAMAGLEVIRRKTMLGRRTDEELYFMLSMFSSYTAYKKLELCAGGYFYLNKEFIIGILSTIFSYFIILYQFQPPLDYQAVDDNQRFCIGQFLTGLEYITDEHDHLNVGHNVIIKECNRTLFVNSMKN